MAHYMEINLVNGALKVGNLKWDIPDPVPLFDTVGVKSFLH